MRVEVGWGDLEEIIQSQRELKPRELERTETSYLHELKHPIRIKITDINNPFRVKNLKTRYFRSICCSCFVTRNYKSIIPFLYLIERNDITYTVRLFNIIAFLS